MKQHMSNNRTAEDGQTKIPIKMLVVLSLGLWLEEETTRHFKLSASENGLQNVHECKFKAR